MPSFVVIKTPWKPTLIEIPPSPVFDTIFSHPAWEKIDRLVWQKINLQLKESGWWSSLSLSWVNKSVQEWTRRLKTPYHRGSQGGWKHRANKTLSLKRTIKGPKNEVGFLNKFSYDQVWKGLGQSLESPCSFRRWRNGSDLSFGFLSCLPQERHRWSILSQAGSVHLADTLNNAAGVPARGYLTHDMVKHSSSP